VFSCIGGCVRGGCASHPLLWAHAVLALRWAGLSRFLVCQVQWGALLGWWQRSSRPGSRIDLQPGLGLVLHNLSIVSTCHPALIQSLIILADSGDLQFVWNVIALDFHRLLEKVKKDHNVIIFDDCLIVQQTVLKKLFLLRKPLNTWYQLLSIFFQDS